MLFFWSLAVASFESNMVGGVWNFFLLDEVRDQHVPCRFCDGDGHLFLWEGGNAPFFLLLSSRKS